MKRYGASFPDPSGNSDPSASIELQMAFNPVCETADGFEGRYSHLRKAIDLIWNIPRRRYAKERGIPYDERKHDGFIWNEWTELMISTLCETHWSTNIWGGNSSWKTTSCAVYDLCAWFASPANTIIVVTSTNLSGLKKRIWKEVLRYYRAANGGMGFVNASDLAIRFQKGSDESGIFGIPTGQDEGDIEKACNKIIGFHNTFVIVTVDEMQATNEAIVKAALSLEAGTNRFQFIGPGNPDSELDSLGRMSEPKGGYETITVDDEKWETKRGVCIHLDGLDSPRVREGDEFYPGLLTHKDIESAKKQYGEDSPEFWRTRRGFIAPQGITKTVLSPALIRKGRAREAATWIDDFIQGAALDPSFEGGDKCMLRFLRCGRMQTGKVGIELGELVQIKTSAIDPEPLHYQIQRQVKQLCEDHYPPVLPRYFAMDSTGEGGGLASIFLREWSREINLIEFGGRASDQPVSEFNEKPSFLEYMNRVTELWYTFRLMVLNDLVRGLDETTAFQFCQRIYYLRGNLKQLETKAEMKVRTKRSPDEADATVVGVEMFREKMGMGIAGDSQQSDEAWRAFQKKHSLHDKNAYLIEV